MTKFIFEIIPRNGKAVINEVVTLSDHRAIWCQVEAIALRIKYRDAALIQVKNARGEIVVRTGVAIALASIEKCPCTSCPLKEGNAERFLNGDSPRDLLPLGGGAVALAK
jgi:hypothetical protein